MRPPSNCSNVLLLLVILLWLPVEAKDGVVATIHTRISSTAIAGSNIDIGLSLHVEDTGEPFTACGIFVRLISSTGHSNESFADCVTGDDGLLHTAATIPEGGVARIEVGIAGTMTFPDGRSKRSDLLFPLANDPIQP